MSATTTRKAPARFNTQLSPAATPAKLAPWAITQGYVRTDVKRLLGDAWACTDDEDAVSAHRGSVRIVVSLLGDWRVRAVVLRGKRAPQQTQVGVPQAVIPDALHIAQG